MAGGISLFGAQAVLGNFFGGLALLPSQFNIALMLNAAPSAFQSAAELDEPAADVGYARLTVPNTGATWTSDQELIYNAADILFPASTAAWGTVRYWALCDELVEGNFYFYGDVGDDMIVEAGDELLIPAGTLNFSLGPLFSGLEDGS